MKKKLCSLILLSLLSFSHSFIYTMFTIGRESWRKKRKDKRKPRERSGSNHRNIPLFDSSTENRQERPLFGNSAPGSPGRAKGNTFFNGFKSMPRSDTGDFGSFSNGGSSRAQMSDEDEENTFRFRRDKDFSGNQGSNFNGGNETINLNFGDMGADISFNMPEFGNMDTDLHFNNTQGIPEENDLNMREGRYVNFQDFGPGNSDQNNCSNNWSGDNSFYQNNRGPNTGNFRPQQNQNSWRQRPNMGWQQRQQENVQRNIRWRQREMQAESLLCLFLKFTLDKGRYAVCGDFYAVKSFLLGLRVTGAENLIKSYFFDSMLLVFIQKAFHEATNSSFSGNSMAAFIDAIAFRMKQQLNQMIWLFNKGLTPYVLGMLAISGLYWFDIRDLMSVGVDPEYLECITTDIATIQVIVKNKKYMPAFLRLGFTGSELMSVIKKLDKYHEDLEKLKKDKSKEFQLKRESFMGFLRLKVRPYGADFSCDVPTRKRNTNFGFFNAPVSPSRRRMDLSSKRRNIQFDDLDDIDCLGEDIPDILDFSEEEEDFSLPEDPNLFPRIDHDDQEILESERIATPPILPPLLKPIKKRRKKKKKKIEIPSYMLSLNEYRARTKGEFKRALFRKRKKKKGPLTLEIKPRKYNSYRIEI